MTISTSGFFLNTNIDDLTITKTTEILENSHSINFHTALPNYKPTPLVELKEQSNKLGVKNIYVKDESYRFGLEAFKGLGASYAVHTILKSKPELTTFCTATDGNHGRAVAWSAKQAGKEARIFVPINTTLARIKAIENEGGIVTKIDKDYDQTCEHALRMSEQNNWELIQDTSWDNYEEIPSQIMAGYLTCFKELEDTVHTMPKAKVDIVFLQAGVGSFAASAIWYYCNRYIKNRPKIVIVEPAESDGILESFKKGKRTMPKGNLNTIMAGLNCGLPSKNAWEIIKNGVDAVMRIQDENAKSAIRELYYPKDKNSKIIAGESGVAGFAGLKEMLTDSTFYKLKEHIGISKDSSILIYNTEGATDRLAFDNIMQE